MYIFSTHFPPLWCIKQWWVSQKRALRCGEAQWISFKFLPIEESLSHFCPLFVLPSLIPSLVPPNPFRDILIPLPFYAGNSRILICRNICFLKPHALSFDDFLEISTLFALKFKTELSFIIPSLSTSYSHHSTKKLSSPFQNLFSFLFNCKLFDAQTI